MKQDEIGWKRREQGVSGYIRMRKEGTGKNRMEQDGIEFNGIQQDITGKKNLKETCVSNNE